MIFWVVPLVFGIFVMYKNLPLTIVFQIPKLRIINYFLVPVAKKHTLLILPD